LHGVTREVVIELARKHGIPAEERELPAEALMLADEIFISSTTFETWPVGMLNGKPVGNGEAGPLWKRIDALFQQYKLQSA
jgi:D-alanine transaminase